MSRMRIGDAVHRRDDQIIESFADRDDPSHGAQHLFARAAGDVAAGYIGVLPLDGVANRGDGNLIGGETVRVDPDVDGAFQAADEANLAHARPSARTAP